LTVTATDRPFDKTIDRFSGGFAEPYDRHRPQPPARLAELLTRLARVTVPDLVVDLGSGTGLSTRYWADKARAVIGIEPTAEMRAQAEARTPAPNVSYRAGFSHHTGLPDRCADVVFCMQSLHWMDPLPTFTEAARILRPGGVFAACDYDWPPATGVWEADAAWEECARRCERLEKEHGVDAGLLRWDKPGHLARMAESGAFRFTREVLLHHVDEGDAARFHGLFLTQGHVSVLLRKGVPASELGLEAFQEAVQRTLGPTVRTWTWSARVRVGVV
jgi:SAM-dependent methyltransferase